MKEEKYPYFFYIRRNIKMKIVFVCVFVFYFLSCLGIYAAEQAILVHNSHQK